MEFVALHKRLISGFVNLVLRQVLILAINFVTINILLARILPVEVIVVFDIASFILSFFNFFSDIGLGAALIQKKELAPDDLKTTFTIQQGLVLPSVIILWFSAPFLASWYQLDYTGM